MLNQKKHYKTQFDHDLETALSLIGTMGERVEKQLLSAIELFSNPNKEEVAVKANKIIEDDKKINSLEVAVSDSCILLITKHNPKASDLRFIISILRASSELERIGDTVNKICYAAVNSSHVSADIISKIKSYSEKSVSLMHSAMNALNSMDVNIAADIYDSDSDLNTAYFKILDELKEKASTNTEHIEEYVNTIIALKQIERIGDRSKNICEFVYYYTYGQIGTKDRFDNIKSKK